MTPLSIGIDLSLTGVAAGAGGGVAPYLGNVGTRNFIPNVTTASTAGWNSRTAHYARDDITALGIVLVNWILSQGGSGEVASANTQTNFASIEYPVGTFTQIKWSGATSVVIASGGTSFSDLMPVTIPKGALFFIRRWQSNTSILLYCNNFIPIMNVALGDKAETSATDKTMGGTIVDSGGGAMIPISGIVAMTKLPTFAIVGSSRMIGAKETVADATGDSGYARMLGGSFGYMSLACPGDTIGSVVTNGTRRMAMALASASHLWIDPGLNDLNTGTTGAATLAVINTITNLWPKKSRVVVNDEGPWTTGAWSTTVGQTVMSWEAQRLTLNNGIDAFTGYNQIVRAADYDETAHNSGFWKNPVSGGSTFTIDGVHENSATLIAMASSGIFNPALVTMA